MPVYLTSLNCAISYIDCAIFYIYCIVFEFCFKFFKGLISKYNLILNTFALDDLKLSFTSALIRTEAEYAYKLNIPIIPLKVDESYTPDGWLGKFTTTSYI